MKRVFRLVLAAIAILGCTAVGGASGHKWPWASFKVVVHESCENLSGVKAEEIAAEVRRKLSALKAPLPEAGDQEGMLLMPKCLVEVDMAGKKPPGRATLVVSRLILGKTTYAGYDANALMAYEISIRHFQFKSMQDTKALIIEETADFGSNYAFNMSFEEKTNLFPSLFTKIGFDEKTDPAAASEARRAHEKIQREYKKSPSFE